jgi:hypothetical protein
MLFESIGIKWCLEIKKPQKSSLGFLLVHYEKSLKNDLFKLTFLNKAFF